VSSVIDGASRIGVDGAHPGNAGIQGDEQVEAFQLTDLADDEPLGTHPQRLADQVPQVISPVPSRLGWRVCMRTTSGLSGLERTWHAVKCIFNRRCEVVGQRMRGCARAVCIPLMFLAGLQLRGGH
jgi:hypothetical protein